MPIYVYECSKCKRQFEVRQKITDPVMKVHSDVTEGHQKLKEICKGEIHRVIQPVGIVFKGKGWTPKFAEKRKNFNKMNQELENMGIKEYGK